MMIPFLPIFNFTKIINKLLTEEKLSQKNIKKVKDFMKGIDKIFGILEETNISKKIKDLVNKREKTRKQKDFKTSDKLREEIKSLGYYVDDTKEGPVIKKL